MVCEVKVQVLEDLKKKNILGEFNDILDPIEFEKFNIEFSRYFLEEIGLLPLFFKLYFKQQQSLYTKYSKNTRYCVYLL